MTRFEVRTGDCLAVMRTLEDSSVDSIVTDPPYELGFMGKSWDASGVAFRVEVWREALRVLKPGGHLLAFSGSRTYHRMAVAIEDAGFEIRDQIMWLYGSGFPKSLDVSKAIDKINAESDRLHRFTAWMRTTGLKAREIDQITGTNMGSHYLTPKSQPAIPTSALWEVLRPHCGYVPAWVDELVKRIEADREVIGVQKNAMSGWSMDQTTKFADRDITAPATTEAKRWQGWGTALKPAHEPIVVARKPLVGTVAANVLAHGTGAINIDGCRVPCSDKAEFPHGVISKTESVFGGGHGRYADRERVADLSPGGRWPANLIHDGSEEVVGMFPNCAGQIGMTKHGSGTNAVFGSFVRSEKSTGGGGTVDSGSAARFFYSAKANKRDRDEGLDGFAVATPGEMTGGRAEGSAGLDSPRAGAGRTTGRANVHPTVKPTDLMRYLCRLVTPPGGLVLDPFTGSGSTGKGAVLEGFRFLGIELSPEYTEIARARIRHAVGHVAPEPVIEAQVPDALPGQLRLFA